MLTLKQTSKEFRVFFLMQFTKEIIRNYGKDEFSILEKTSEDKIKEKIREKEEKRENIFSSIENKPPLIFPFQSQKQIMPRQLMRPTIPRTIQNIRPTPTSKQIDLGKLNPLIKDPTVTVIECIGPDKNITVKRMKEKRTTGIKLNKQEIKQVIQKFSQESKIPVQEGSFKVAVGALIFSAIISEVIEPKFIITKMLYM